MRPAVNVASVCVPWLLFAGLFLGLGVAIGRFAPWFGGAATVAEPAWSEPVPPAGVPVAAGAANAMPSLAPLVQRVRRGVVGVRTFTPPTAERGEGAQAVAVAGTGFVIHEGGLILTNHHLVAGSKSIRVELPDASVNAELVGEDAVTDLAVLRVKDLPASVQPLSLGDSTNVQEGDWVLTLGNPLRFRGTVTVGVVSSVGRHLPERGGQVTNEFLQFSAPVNPGSSGSPVVDMAGNVIGITTRNHTEAQAIAFAVPSKVIKWVLAALQSPDGRVRRAHLGIAFDRLSRDRAERYGVPDGCGARITHVREGSVAEGVGLAKGDVVLVYDGHEVSNVGELYDWITYSRPGTHVELEVLRPGTGKRKVAVTLGELSAPVPVVAGEETELPEVPAQ